jgi:hypothetical protein
LQKQYRKIPLTFKFARSTKVFLTKIAEFLCFSHGYLEGNLAVLEMDLRGGGHHHGLIAASRMAFERVLYA